jgi:competence protein ComEA
MIRMLTGTMAALVLSAAVALAQDTAKRPVTTAAMINLNTASVTQLETLPGVGKATAERIVEYREKNGAFKKIEDLMNVRGVGEKSFLKLKPLITVSAAKLTPTEQ